MREFASGITSLEIDATSKEIMVGDATQTLRMAPFFCVGTRSLGMAQRNALFSQIFPSFPCSSSISSNLSDPPSSLTCTRFTRVGTYLHLTKNIPLWRKRLIRRTRFSNTLAAAARLLVCPRLQSGDVFLPLSPCWLGLGGRVLLRKERRGDSRLCCRGFNIETTVSQKLCK